MDGSLFLRALLWRRGVSQASNLRTGKKGGVFSALWGLTLEDPWAPSFPKPFKLRVTHLIAIS